MWVSFSDALGCRNDVSGASGGSFMSSERTVWSSPELCWTRQTLRRRSGSAPEASRGRSGEAWGALGELSGASGDAPGTPRKRFWEARRRPEAKTAECSKMMTLIALSLCFRGPEASEMRPTCSRRRKFRTSEYGRAQKASREASWERLGSSRTAFGTARWPKKSTTVDHRGLVKRMRRGGYCSADDRLLTESDESDRS